jgi:hypothetical protein
VYHPRIVSCQTYYCQVVFSNNKLLLKIKLSLSCFSQVRMLNSTRRLVIGNTRDNVDLEYLYLSVNVYCIGYVPTPCAGPKPLVELLATGLTIERDTTQGILALCQFLPSSILDLSHYQSEPRLTHRTDTLVSMSLQSRD